jgi:hypothetical protein
MMVCEFIIYLFPFSSQASWIEISFCLYLFPSYLSYSFLFFYLLSHPNHLSICASFCPYDLYRCPSSFCPLIDPLIFNEIYLFFSYP